MGSRDTALVPQLKLNLEKQTFSEPANLVQVTRHSTAPDLPITAATPEVSRTHEPNTGRSARQGHDEINSSAMLDYSGFPHRPAGSTPHPITNETTVEQLRHIVLSQHAQLHDYQQRLPTIQHLEQIITSQNVQLYRYERSTNDQETYFSHAEALNTAIVELEAAIAPFVPAVGVPSPGTVYCHGYDVAERQRPGALTRIGTVRFATWKLQELGGFLAPAFRSPTETMADNISHPVPTQTPAHDPGDAIAKEDWKGKSAAAQRQAVVQNEPHTGKLQRVIYLWTYG